MFRPLCQAECRKSEGELKQQERRRAREKELLDAWGGVGLGNSMKPHLSKIERDKVTDYITLTHHPKTIKWKYQPSYIVWTSCQAAWRKLEEEQKQICASTTREA